MSNKLIELRAEAAAASVALEETVSELGLVKMPDECDRNLCRENDIPYMYFGDVGSPGTKYRYVYEPALEYLRSDDSDYSQTYSEYDIIGDSKLTIDPMSLLIGIGIGVAGVGLVKGVKAIKTRINAKKNISEEKETNHD